MFDVQKSSEAAFGSKEGIFLTVTTYLINFGYLINLTCVLQ